jgi:hypothetical protein
MDARIVASTNPLSGSWWVTTMGTVSGVIEAIQMWVRELHSGITDLQKSILHPESLIIRIVPRNPKSTEVSFQLDSSGVDVCCARHSSFEDVPLDVDLILDICEAARQGHLTIEITHPYGGLSFQEKATLTLSSGVWYDTYGGLRWPFLQYLSPQTIRSVL